MNDEPNDDGRTTEDLSSDATATIATILAEVRDTAPTGTREHVAEMIRSRLDRAGIGLADSEVDELATQVVEGHE